jgi:predicted nucleic acid-binding protein
MIIYADSSSILSFHLMERDRHDLVASIYQKADSIASHIITLAEVRSGLARARFRENPARLDDQGYGRAVRDFLLDWPRYNRIPVSAKLIREAGQLTEKHLLRGFDAVHLAAALLLSRVLPGEIHIATWDKELAQAAKAEGLPLAHEVTT